MAKFEADSIEKILSDVNDSKDEMERRVKELRDEFTAKLENLKNETNQQLQTFDNRVDNLREKGLLEEGSAKRQLFVMLEKITADRIQQVHKTKLVVDTLLSNPEVRIQRMPSGGDVSNS